MAKSHCFHPPSPTSLMECHKGFAHCSSGENDINNESRSLVNMRQESA